ncbi:MAG: DUF5110 domain-containing protein [Bacteroidales bacterium]
MFPASTGLSAAFTLYEDDGETNNYKKDSCRRTEITCFSQKEAWNLSIIQHQVGMKSTEPNRNLGIRIHLTKHPGRYWLIQAN